LHLVGYLYYCIRDARSRKHQLVEDSEARGQHVQLTTYTRQTINLTERHGPYNDVNKDAFKRTVSVLQNVKTFQSAKLIKKVKVK